VLGWRPHTELEAGLTRTIAYFDKLLSQRGHRPNSGATRAAARRAAPLPVK
jgi:hypothetical protein